MKKFLNDLNFKLISISLLIILTTFLSFTAFGFIINININKYTLVWETTLAFIFIYLIFKKDFKNHNIFLKHVIVILLIMYLASLIGLQFYDFSWDGNTYHKNLIGLLAGGLNPLYNTNIAGLWAIHYANAYEIMAGVFYAFFNNIEVGKAIDIILSVVLFYNVYEIAYNISKNKIKAIIFSIPLVFSPLFLSQFTNFYLDDLVGITLYLSMISLFKMIYTKDYKMQNKYNLLTFICSTLICINLKFQALFICGLFSVILGCYIIINNLKNHQYQIMFRQIGLFVLVYSVGFLLIGSSTYVKNTYLFHNPFYPVFGSSEVNIEQNNEPVNFSSLKNRGEKWLYATLANSNTSYTNVVLKTPFTLRPGEIECLQAPDIMIGGFGPWFSGLLIIAFVIGVIELIYLIKIKSRFALILLLLVAGIVLPINFLPVVWQARYYPQIYLLPFLVLMPLLVKKNWLTNLAFGLISFIAIVNILFWAPSIKKYYLDSRNLNNELSYLAQASLNNKILISLNDQVPYLFEGINFNFKDKNIDYIYIQDSLSNDAKPIYRFYKYEILSYQDVLKIMKEVE